MSASLVFWISTPQQVRAAMARARLPLCEMEISGLGLDASPVFQESCGRPVAELAMENSVQAGQIRSRQRLLQYSCTAILAQMRPASHSFLRFSSWK
jgi:hypothetical protein